MSGRALQSKRVSGPIFHRAISDGSVPSCNRWIRSPLCPSPAPKCKVGLRNVRLKFPNLWSTAASSNRRIGWANPRVYSRRASTYSTQTQSRDRNNHTDTVWRFGRPRCSARRRCIRSDALATSGNGVPILSRTLRGGTECLEGKNRPRWDENA